jgi:hypothetical protein
MCAVAEWKLRASVNFSLHGGEQLTSGCGPLTPYRNSAPCFPTPLSGPLSPSEQGGEQENLPLPGETPLTFRH